MKNTKKQFKTIKQPTPLYKPIKIQKPNKISIKTIPQLTKVTSSDNPPKPKEISSLNHLSNTQQPYQKGQHLKKQSSNTSIQLNYLTQQQSTKQPFIQQISQLKQTIKNYQQQKITQTHQIITIQSQKQILIKQKNQLKNKYQKIKKISQQNSKALRNHINSYNQEASEIQLLQNKLITITQENQILKMNKNKQQINIHSKVYVDSQTITTIQSSIQTEYQNLKNQYNQLNSKYGQLRKQYDELKKLYDQQLVRITQYSHHKSQFSLETNHQQLNDIILKDQFNQIANKIQNKYIKQIQQIEEIFNKTMYQYYQNVREKQQEIFKLQEALDRLYEEKQQYSIFGQYKTTINMDQMLLKSIQENQKLRNKIHQLKQENMTLKLNEQEKSYDIARINNQLNVEIHRRKLMEEQMINDSMVQKQIINQKYQVIKSKLAQIENKNTKLTQQNKEKEEIIKLMSIKKKINIMK